MSDTLNPALATSKIRIERHGDRILYCDRESGVPLVTLTKRYGLTYFADIDVAGAHGVHLDTLKKIILAAELAAREMAAHAF